MKHKVNANYIRDFIVRPTIHQVQRAGGNSATLKQTRIAEGVIAAASCWAHAPKGAALLAPDVHRAQFAGRGGEQKCARCGLVLIGRRHMILSPGQRLYYFAANTPVVVSPAGARAIDLDVVHAKFCKPLFLERNAYLSILSPS